MTLPAPDALPAPLTAVQFQTLADVPPEIACFANLTNPNTRHAYRQDMRGFQAFTGLRRPEEFRDVTRAHVIVWREDLTRQQRANDTIRRKLVARSSLYASLCERHAVLHDPVLGVKGPRSMNREGVTPAIGAHQARKLLDAPPERTLTGQRDRAILATLLYHAIRREELCTRKVGDVQQRQGVPYLRVDGKGDTVRSIEAATEALRLIATSLKTAGHAQDLDGPLFRPVKNTATTTLAKPLHPASVYRDVVRHDARAAGLLDAVPGLCAHALRATAATTALAHKADLATAQVWLGHADIATTRVYDKRQARPEDSPTCKVWYDA